MTETRTPLAEAIAACDGIKARLEVLQDMHSREPALCIKSLIRLDHTWELCCASDLARSEGTVIEASDGWRYYRLSPGRGADWRSNTGQTYSHEGLWNNLTSDAANGITFEYSGNF